MYLQNVPWSQIFFGVSFHCFLLICSSDLKMLQICVAVTKNLFLLFFSSINFILRFILQSHKFISHFQMLSMKEPCVNLMLNLFLDVFFYFEGCHFCFWCRNNSGFLAFVPSLLNFEAWNIQNSFNFQRILAEMNITIKLFSYFRATFHYPNCNKFF